MIWQLVVDCGVWAFVLAPLLVWATTLLLHRAACRARGAQLRSAWSRTLQRLENVFANLGVSVPPDATARQRDFVLGRACQQAAGEHPELARAVAMAPEEFEAEVLPVLLPADEGARRGEQQLETVANLAPALGLGGTVAGIAALFAAITRTGLQNGLGDLGEPGRLAMATTLLAIPSLVLALLALGLIAVDPFHLDLRADLIRWHRAVRRHAQRIGGASADAEPRLLERDTADEDDAFAPARTAAGPDAGLGRDTGLVPVHSVWRRAEGES